MFRRLAAACALALPLVAGPVPAVAVATTASAGVAPWLPPLAPVQVTRRFDAPSSPYGRGHRGVDLAGAPGQVVVAAGSGIVVFAGIVAGRPVVSIAHFGGLRTTYEPVVPAVRAGVPVARGSPIGALAAGHPGCPVAACLHWGARRGEGYLDPLLLLRPPQVRLLPWP